MNDFFYTAKNRYSSTSDVSVTWKKEVTSALHRTSTAPGCPSVLHIRGDQGELDRIDFLRTRCSPRRSRRSATRRPIGKISAKCCSFSAVSAPIFARKYAFFSIFQNLPAELSKFWQLFADFATFAKFCQISKISA